MHAVVPAKPEHGPAPGVIFTLRNRNTSVNVNQHNRLHPYYLVYINREGEVIHDHTEVKRLLDLVRTLLQGASQPIPGACRLFNKETADGRQMQVYSDLLGKAIRSMIEVKEEKDLDSLFTGGKTTALVNTIAGLDDFELITFLVIQEVDELPALHPAFVLPQAGRVWPHPAQEQDLRAQRCQHAAEGLVRRAGGADRLAIQAGAGNDQPARKARRAGASGLRDPAQDARAESGRFALHRRCGAIPHRGAVEARTQVVAAYKRPSEADSSLWVCHVRYF
jgi:uncharacterized membrane protein